MDWEELIPERELGEDGIGRLTPAVVQALLGEPAPFVLWLDAPMGAGKTTFARHLLHHLGLPAGQPVTSPTYTLLNEYRIGDDWYAHLDLYRTGGDFDLESLDLPHQRAYRGFLVEWMDVGAGMSQFDPTHRLSIVPSGDATRRYALWRRRT